MFERPVEVLCVGHAAFDVCLFVKDFPIENTKCEIHDLEESGGGPAANAAYLLSSWGISCAFAGVIGDDHYGMKVQSEFQSVGTNISLLEIRRGHSTPFSIIIVNRQNGSRTIINRKTPTAAMHLDIPAAHQFAPRLLLFDGHELEASLQALERFPEAISILDAGSMRAGTQSLAGQVDYLAASERFALEATGLPDLSNDRSQRLCLEKLRQSFQTPTIVTLGDRGLIADDGTGFRFSPAFPGKAIDTTAAGDIFHGAFAYALLKRFPFSEGLRFASMAASLSVRKQGGRKSIPTLKMVKEALVHAQ